jgi:hypothetical protein
MVGDRGMISKVQIDAMATLQGVDWITALKSGAIAKLARISHTGPPSRSISGRMGDR